MGAIAKWLGGNAGGIVNAGVNLYSTIQNNKNIDKQLAAQSEENEKNRKYNLQLAQMQNSWNIAMQDRENSYNTPSAQKARLEAAGLNPDMMYGGIVSNTSAPSPDMTSGAPSNPMDWSSLSNKKTVGNAIMESLAIEQARANVDKTRGEAKQAGINADILAQYGIDTAELNKSKLTEEVNKLAAEAKTIDLNSSVSQLQNDFVQVYRSKIVDNWLQRLTASTKMSENELKEDIETLALRIAGVNAENSRLDRMSNFTTQEWALVIDVIKFMFGAVK